VTGGALGRYWHQAQVPSRHPAHSQNAKQGGPAFGGGPRLEFLRRAQRELALTPEQRERIDKVIRDGQERTKALMMPVSAQVHEELQKTRQEFREILTPEQQARFEELLKQEKHSHESRRGNASRENSGEASTNQPGSKSPF
jgi:Spy/CpxP family protein refolding chaperone